ncbi:hypothetical protein GIB67_028878 [Kingdonia uniflora]|uniref:Transcription factor CBF/NF-Y/archaeal histone domain-containing protein n=1 Tax=Kingdonia uniflora TaxID=39325 RepID=A0A7J7LT99_9MAGN|nr:hypothetical protein GIB67_028878 [Kingdonia uniflora]
MRYPRVDDIDLTLVGWQVASPVILMVSAIWFAWFDLDREKDTPYEVYLDLWQKGADRGSNFQEDRLRSSFMGFGSVVSVGIFAALNLLEHLLEGSRVVEDQVLFGTAVIWQSVRIREYDIREDEVFNFVRFIEKPLGEGFEGFIAGFLKIEEGIDPDLSIFVEGKLGGQPKSKGLEHLGIRGYGIEDRRCPVFSDTVVAVGSDTVVIERRAPPFCLMEEDSFKSRIQNLQKQNLEAFWEQQMLEISQLSADFKYDPELPVARIKKIMKANEEMTSADAPITLAKACEFFIQELTIRSWLHTKENSRGTLQSDDVENAISHEEALDFLVDVVPLIFSDLVNIFLLCCH